MQIPITGVIVSWLCNLCYARQNFIFTKLEIASTLLLIFIVVVSFAYLSEIAPFAALNVIGWCEWGINIKYLFKLVVKKFFKFIA